MQSLSKEKITFYLQDNLSVLVDTSSKIAQESAFELIKFSELVKIPKGFHTYQISPLSIWNACASGIPIDNIVICLKKYSLRPLPEKFKEQLFLYYNRYNKIFLRQHSSTHIRLETLLSELVPLFQSHEFQFEYDLIPESNNSFLLPIKFRGAFKQKMIHIGYPVEDLVGYAQGDTFKVNLREQTKLGSALNIRHYQREAVDRFFDSPLSKNGSGVIVLPCGAGKTLVGLCALSHISEYTLILTNSMTSAYQWRRELLDKTTVQEHEVEIYSSENKITAPITISTYQMLTYRPSKESEFLHFDLFDAKSWGLIIYDEVHLLPAPVFRITAELQSKKRLGLTATLIREDGHEGDVFALIGPKKYDLPWKELEKEQFIATAKCIEWRVPFEKGYQMTYALADKRAQFKIASTNPQKLKTLKDIINLEENKKILVIGEYLEQVYYFAESLNVPCVSGATPQDEREKIYKLFRDGELRILVLSRVGNFALDLPDAEVLIQISGKFGSRQEEAQRLGRILRPKKNCNQATFHTLVTHPSCEERFARNRQLFLLEQGYEYQVNPH